MTNTVRPFFFALILLCFSCSSTKDISSLGELNKALTPKQIIKAHTKSEAKFKTLQSRIKIEYFQGNKSQAHTVNLRLEKDKTIWMSASLGIVRIKITPEKVSFYNKLDNTFFDGDFSLISNVLGTELNFDNLQSLLLGDAVFNIEDNNYIADIAEKSYVLHPKKQNDLLEIFLLINPLHFKMDSQQFSQMAKRKLLQIDYKKYQEVDNQVLPKTVTILALENRSETVINLEFKSIALNIDLRYPFRIPSGFDEIVIK